MKTFASIFFLLMIFSACSSNEGSGNENATGASGEPGSTATAGGSGKRYTVKSAIIHAVNEAMGMKMNTITYFDDYGNMEATETEYDMEVMPGESIKIHTLAFTKDGYSYNLDLVANTGTKYKVAGMPSASSSGAPSIDWGSMAEDAMKDMGVTKGGTETVAGKTCDVWEINSEKMGMKGRFVTWHNVSVKMDSEMGGMAMKMYATQIEEGVSIPKEKFEVPEGMVVTET